MKKSLILSNRSLPMDYGTGELPARIHIVPRGELVNKEAGVTQVLDDAALKSILADLQTGKASNGGLYMGEEHFIYNADRSSEAFAWAKEFSLDDKGIWATAYEPTDVGAPALKNKRFKWTSFAADPASPGAVENLGKGRVRILKIDTVGFTNFPNGKSLLDPMSNRSLRTATDGKCTDCATQLESGDDGMTCPDCGKTFADSRESADSTANNQLKNKKMKTVCTLLGLSAEADEPSVHAAVTKLLNRGDIARDALKILQAEHKTFGDQNATLQSEQLDGLLAEHKVTDTKIVNRLKPILAPLANRADRVACLVELGFKPGETKTAPAKQYLNRGGNGQQQQSQSGAEVTPALINSEVRKLMNRDGIKDFTTGYNALMAERPELFAPKE